MVLGAPVAPALLPVLADITVEAGNGGRMRRCSGWCGGGGCRGSSAWLRRLLRVLHLWLLGRRLLLRHHWLGDGYLAHVSG